MLCGQHHNVTWSGQHHNVMCASKAQLCFSDALVCPELF